MLEPRVFETRNRQLLPKPLNLSLTPRNLSGKQPLSTGDCAMFDQDDLAGAPATAEGETAQATEAHDTVVEEPRIMCYVSKEMVPMSETVEVEYETGKTFRVMPKFLKYAAEATE